MGRKLYVGNLGYDVSGRDLEEKFANHGGVNGAIVVSDQTTGQSKGFGFVKMASDAEAMAAIQALDGEELSGRAMTVHEANLLPAHGGKRGRR